jgi:hypothetical protein
MRSNVRERTHVLLAPAQFLRNCRHQQPSNQCDTDSSVTREAPGGQLLSPLLYRSTWLLGARGSVVGWGTMLQAERSRVRFLMKSLDFFNWPNPSSRTMSLGSTQPLCVLIMPIVTVMFPYLCPLFNMWFEYPELLLLLLTACIVSLYLVWNA